MRSLLFKGGPMGDVYRSIKVRAWPAGNVRQVDDEHASELLTTFPEYFEESATNTPTAADLIAQIKAGELDADLEMLYAGETRKTVLKAMEARFEELDASSEE